MTEAQRALIYSMVLTSACDGDITDGELATIGDIVRMTRAFAGFTFDQLPTVAEECSMLLQDEEGLDRLLDVIEDGLPLKLRETAYLFATEVAACDGHVSEEELRVLELLRDRLQVDRLHAAALEWATRARIQTA